MTSHRRPICTIVGGPNGSGKSTLVESMVLEGEIVNADVVARMLAPDDPESASVRAAREVILRLGTLMEGRRSFNYETTLSSAQSLLVMKRALAAGYEVDLLFVVLDDVEMNVARVGMRVAQGGHRIPTEIVRRRYEKSLNNLGHAIALASEAAIVDNSRCEPSTLIEISEKQILVDRLEGGVPLHNRIAVALTGLTASPAQVWNRPA